MRFIDLAAAAAFIAGACGKEVQGIFTDVTGFESSGNSWVYYRRVNMKWAINPGQLNVGDTFTMHMPCMQPTRGFELRANGKVFATCVSENLGTADSVMARCTEIGRAHV